MTQFTSKQFSRVLTQLASVPSQIARPVADEFKRLTEEGFDRGTDPYGKAWAPLRPRTLRKGRTPPPLTDSRAGRDGIRFRPNGRAGIRVIVDMPYMGFHQDGTEHMARRRVLPDARLPKTWREVWQRELTKATKERLRRGK